MAQAEPRPSLLHPDPSHGTVNLTSSFHLTGEMEDMGAGGGWSWVLSDLKSLLETGTSIGWPSPAKQG